jgi:WD40 repeat protein
VTPQASASYIAGSYGGAPQGEVTRPTATVAPEVKVKEPGRFARLRFWDRSEPAAPGAGPSPGQARPLHARVESLGTGPGGPLGLGVVRLADAAPCGPVLAFLPDGSILYSDRGRLLTRQSADGRTTRLGPLGNGPFMVAVSPSGRLAAVGDKAGRVWVWDLGGQRLLHRLEPGQSVVTALAFSPDDRVVAVGGKDGTVSLWVADEGSRLTTLQAHDGAVNFLYLTAGGQQIWTGGWDKTLRLYNLATGRMVRRYTFPEVWGDAMAIDLGGHYVAMENHNEVRLWDLAGGGEIATLRGHQTWVRALRFGADGRSLLTASEDGEVILWDVPSGGRIQAWKPVAGVCGVAVSPDGERIALATRDETTIHPTGGVDDLIAIARLQQEGVDIDWSLGTADLPPYPVVEVRSSPEDGQVVAGDRFSLTVNLYNRGKGDLFRAKARLTSPHPALDGRTFYFGRVAPAGQRDWTVVVDLPRDLPIGEIPFSLDFDEANGYVPRGIEGVLRVEPLPRPEFRYSHRIVDDMSGSSVGNGDGVLQPGEAVDVIVSVRNVGAGPARDLQVDLTPIELAGVRVRSSGRAIDLLRPDEIAEIAMTLVVSPRITAREVPVQLRIHEGGFGIDFTDRLSFPVDDEPPREVRTVAGQVRARHPLEIFSGAGRKTSVVAQVNGGDLLEAVGELPEWVQVKLAGDRTGWVEAAGVEKLY